MSALGLAYRVLGFILNMSKNWSDYFFITVTVLLFY